MKNPLLFSWKKRDASLPVSLASLVFLKIYVYRGRDWSRQLIVNNSVGQSKKHKSHRSGRASKRL